MKPFILIYVILIAAFTLSLLAMRGHDLNSNNATLTGFVWIASLATTLAIIGMTTK